MLTRRLFDSIFPTKGLNPQKYNLVRERDLLIETLNEVLPRYGITTYLRVCAFLGNCGIETDFFRTTTEYASGEDYEWRGNLGNVYTGDGRRFKGRGLTQTTGRANYAAVNKTYGARVGIDFLKNPAKLAEVRHAVESACVFWDDHKLNDYADRGQFKELSAIVNRGDKNKTPLHWAKRNELYSKCKRMIPRDFGLTNDLLSNKQDVQNQQLTSQSSANQALLSNKPDPAQTNSTARETQTDSSASAGSSTTVSLKDAANKYLKHCPRDTVKNILTVVGLRIAGGVTAVWSLGLHGQIALVAIGLIALGCSIYALYYYAPRIFGWAKNILDSFIDS